jgi:hypothetical protein
MAKLHPSTWAEECAQLRKLNTELTLQALASDGQAAEAHEARLIAEAEAKALRARVVELEAALEWAYIGDGLDDCAITIQHMTKPLQKRSDITPNHAVQIGVRKVIDMIRARAAL